MAQASRTKVTLDHFGTFQIRAGQRFKLRHLQKLQREREKVGSQFVANFKVSNQSQRPVKVYVNRYQDACGNNKGRLLSLFKHLRIVLELPLYFAKVSFGL